MATLKQCEAAIGRLAAALDGVDSTLRQRHVPRRTVACHVSDLGVTFSGRLDEHGLHDLTRSDDGAVDVRVTMSSEELLALADGREDFLRAWLRGRVQVSASMRDLLRLRSLFI